MPLFITITLGCSAWTNASEFEVSCPWCGPSSTSIVPTRLTGHISSRSLSLVRSPGWSARNLPKVNEVATDWVSSGIAFAFMTLEVAQNGFGLPAPASGVRMGCPPDITTRVATPAKGIVSPAFTTVCVPFA